MIRTTFKRFLGWSNRQIEDLRKGNSGDWAWLTVKPMPLAVLNRKLWKGADPSLAYYVLLSLSVVIATLGPVSYTHLTLPTKA
jgi:hypothetical protein